MNPIIIFRYLMVSSFLSAFAFSFDLVSFLSEIVLGSPSETLRYRGYDGELTSDLHPFFKSVYRIANSRKNGNESGRTYFYDINIRPQQFLPSGAQLTNKWQIFVPVRNTSRFRNALNFDLYAYLPLYLFVPYLKQRKRRSVSLPEEGYRTKEEVQKLIQEKRSEKLTFFKAIIETLEQYHIPAKDCVLKLVCEIFESPFMEGMLGEFINTVFRATVHDDWSDLSRHFNDDEYDDFIKAEHHGRMKGNCRKFYSRCSRSVFDLLPYTHHHIIRRRK